MHNYSHCLIILKNLQITRIARQKVPAGELQTRSPEALSDRHAGQRGPGDRGAAEGRDNARHAARHSRAHAAPHHLERDTQQARGGDSPAAERRQAAGELGRSGEAAADTVQLAEAAARRRATHGHCG